MIVFSGIHLMHAAIPRENRKNQFDVRSQATCVLWESGCRHSTLKQCIHFTTPLDGNVHRTQGWRLNAAGSIRRTVHWKRHLHMSHVRRMVNFTHTLFTNHSRLNAGTVRMLQGHGLLISPRRREGFYESVARACVPRIDVCPIYVTQIRHIAKVRKTDKK